MVTTVANGGAVKHVIVVGAGMGGLTTALALGRAGHRVTILERDPLADSENPEAAFTAERRGAPQVHQTHGFLARLQVTFRDEFPDVFEQLLGAGGTPMGTTANLGEPRPGDEDLKVIVVRRTTLEWVLRRAVLGERGITLERGVVVAGLESDGGSPPTVTGVRLQDGPAMGADLVVVANGRRSPLPAWLAAIGVEIPETIRESGLMYMTRWYRFPPERRVELDPKLGGDLGFVKYLGVPGDGDTLSVTLAIRADDAELRALLAGGSRFDEACRILPGPDRFFLEGPLEPIGDVRPMGGLLNRLRRFTDEDGTPLALRAHAVGDAHTCTNPLYGRGCALAAVQAVLLRDALLAHPDDPAARGLMYEAGCEREVAPWFEVSVQMDRLGADPSGFAGSGDGKAMAAVFAAAATDPVIGRGLLRFWNLMATPAELAADAEFLGRVAEVMATPDAYPIDRPVGPTRVELVTSLTARDDAA
jgi:2-polyprenyl-6-methoxyphenol hydroxylase-like FAD-dependent oxidoreductase